MFVRSKCFLILVILLMISLCDSRTYITVGHLMTHAECQRKTFEFKMSLELYAYKEEIF